MLYDLVIVKRRPRFALSIGWFAISWYFVCFLPRNQEYAWEMISLCNADNESIDFKWSPWEVSRIDIAWRSHYYDDSVPFWIKPSWLDIFLFSKARYLVENLFRRMPSYWSGMGWHGWTCFSDWLRVFKPCETLKCHLTRLTHLIQLNRAEMAPYLPFGLPSKLHFNSFGFQSWCCDLT